MCDFVCNKVGLASGGQCGSTEVRTREEGGPPRSDGSPSPVCLPTWGWRGLAGLTPPVQGTPSGPRPAAGASPLGRRGWETPLTAAGVGEMWTLA